MDGGGALPGQPIDRSAQTLFVGTTSGLFVTEDGGQSWLLALAEGHPASMVASVGDGRVFAFVIGQGLFVGGNAGQPWDLVAPATAFEGALLHMAGNFAGTLFAVTQFMKLLVSDDDGGTWTGLRPEHRENSCSNGGLGLLNRLQAPIYTIVLTRSLTRMLGL